MFGVTFVADYLFSTLSQTRHAMENRHAQQAFLFLVFGIYFVWFWAQGQTLAMKTWNIRVTDVRGHRLTQQRAWLRYVLSWVWFLPPLLGSSIAGLDARQAIAISVAWVVLWATLARFHPQGQFWHDVLAGTRLETFRAPEVKRG